MQYPMAGEGIKTHSSPAAFQQLSPSLLFPSLCHLTQTTVVSSSLISISCPPVPCTCRLLFGRSLDSDLQDVLRFGPVGSGGDCTAFWFLCASEGLAVAGSSDTAIVPAS